MRLKFCNALFIAAVRNYSATSNVRMIQAHDKYVLTSTHKCEDIIKKSKFACIVSPVSSVTEAEAALASFRDPQATHTCWAYVVGGSERSSDDGEPSGTAGRPMLAAISAEKVTDVVAAINRYYGGIKLGTGGLARAYGGLTRTTIQQAPKAIKIDRCTVTITTHVDMSPQLHQVLRRPGNSVIRHSEEVVNAVESGASLRFVFSVDEAKRAEVVDQLQRACKGAIKIEYS